MGKYADELSFTPHSPHQSVVDHAVQVLNPVSVQFHQVRFACAPQDIGTPSAPPDFSSQRDRDLVIKYYLVL